MLQTLEGEGIHFAAQHIDRTFEHEHAPTRKPGTAMLTQYMTPEYDLKHSYVIGDRATDVQLAVNLGCQAILLQPAAEAERMLTEEQRSALALATTDWSVIAERVRATQRCATIARKRLRPTFTWK